MVLKTTTETGDSLSRYIRWIRGLALLVKVEVAAPLAPNIHRNNNLRRVPS